MAAGLSSHISAFWGSQHTRKSTAMEPPYYQEKSVSSSPITSDVTDKAQTVT